MERLGFWPARMLAQAFRTSDFFMKDPQVPKSCLVDEGFRGRLAKSSGADNKWLELRQEALSVVSYSYDIQEWPSGVEFRAAESTLNCPGLSGWVGMSPFFSGLVMWLPRYFPEKGP